MRQYLDAARNVPLTSRLGTVAAIAGYSLEALGPDVTIGEVCEITPQDAPPLAAEAVGLQRGRVVLMPYGALRGVGIGDTVRATGVQAGMPVGPALLGRVIDAFGQPLDGGAVPQTTEQRPLQAPPMNPLSRPRIDQVLETGVRAIEGLLPVGRGQRIGIFAGSGVG